MSVRREMRGFAIGSMLFALGAAPGYVGLVGVTADNVTYFLGSIFFTIAGFTQLRLTGRWQRGGWSSKDAWDDWWAAAIQFLGTLAFNVSTFFAIAGNLDPETFKNLVWRPDFIGSICFMVASVLAVKATTHRESLWDPEARNWWNTWINMAGSVFFMVSAIFAWINPSTGEPISTDITNLGTFAGAICFFAAACCSSRHERKGRLTETTRRPTANPDSSGGDPRATRHRIAPRSRQSSGYDPIWGLLTIYVHQDRPRKTVRLIVGGLCLWPEGRRIQGRGATPG